MTMCVCSLSAMSNIRPLSSLHSSFLSFFPSFLILAPSHTHTHTHTHSLSLSLSLSIVTVAVQTYSLLSMEPSFIMLLLSRELCLHTWTCYCGTIILRYSFFVVLQLPFVMVMCMYNYYISRGYIFTLLAPSYLPYLPPSPFLLPPPSPS